MIIGDIVLSKSGRDKGCRYMVADIINEKFLLVCDGKHHSIQSPKTKNIKHVVKLSDGNPDYLSDKPGSDKKLYKYLNSD